MKEEVEKYDNVGLNESEWSHDLVMNGRMLGPN